MSNILTRWKVIIAVLALILITGIVILIIKPFGSENELSNPKAESSGLSQLSESTVNQADLSSDESNEVYTPVRGNTVGNNFNEGLAVLDDDWIYYVNKSDNNYVYKIRTDGTGREKVE